MYLYFLIPLMVIVVAPALDGIRPQWREAAENLGASRWQYWRHVGGPVLAPPVLGGTLLLFCGALSAFATAQALVGSTIPLVTLQIANVLSGNVLIGQEGLGAALALYMVVVVGLVMAVYWWVQRRTRDGGCDDHPGRHRGRGGTERRGPATARLVLAHPGSGGALLPDPAGRVVLLHRGQPGHRTRSTSTRTRRSRPRSGSSTRCAARSRWPCSPWSARWR